MLRRDSGRRANAWALMLFAVIAMGLLVPMERADAATETNDDDHWITTDAAVTQTHELVIVNLSTPDYEILVDDLVADRGDGRVFEVVMLDTDRGGIEQLSALLGERTGLDAVHIISHGDDGSIALGNELLDLDALTANAEAIQGWGDSFAADGDLLDPDFASNGGQGWFLTLQARLTESALNPIVDFWGNRMRSTMARRGER